MLVGQVVKTFGAFNFMNFEIGNYVTYKLFKLEKMLRYKKIPRNLAFFFFYRESSLEFTKIDFEKQNSTTFIF